MQPYGYVYRWDNLINGKSYIGSHNGRKSDYIGSGYAFKRAWIKYPEDCWIRTILYRGPEFRAKETECIQKAEALQSDLYYNLMHWTEGYCEQSAETRLKMSKTRKGKPLSEEAKKNMRKPKSEEHKQKLAQSMTGKIASQETKLKMSKSRKGKPLSEEAKKKMRKPKPTIQCPHCLKSGSSSNMKRWHFNNCKFKKEQ